MPKSAPWHYVDVPPDEPRYDGRFAGDATGKGYIVPKITEFLNVLGNPDAPVAERRTALRFVVHLVGDLHQPLHVGDNGDRGGNDTQIRWFTHGSNMHRVWDSVIIDRAGTNEDRWLAELVAMDTDASRKTAQAGAVEDWATESLLAARQAYQDPATGRRITPGTRLGTRTRRPACRPRSGGCIKRARGWRLCSTRYFRRGKGRSRPRPTVGE